jgi:hypothetical protein
MLIEDSCEGADWLTECGGMFSFTMLEIRLVIKTPSAVTGRIVSPVLSAGGYKLDYRFYCRGG